MIVDELEIGSNRVDPVRYPRPIVSTLDTWDQSTHLDYHYDPALRGIRPGWNIPSIAVTSETVNTVRSSAATRFVSPNVATRVGMLADKVMTLPHYKPMPNMAQVIRSDSDVQISFCVTVSAAPAGHTPYFAVFRDGVKISMDYRAEAANYFLVSAVYVDTTVRMGLHTYDLRWKVDPNVPNATVTANGRNRTFQVSNLRAQ